MILKSYFFQENEIENAACQKTVVLFRTACFNWSRKTHSTKRIMFHQRYLGGNPAEAWWRHQMETFSALLAMYEGNPPVTGGFPSQGQWRGPLMFSLICTKNKWLTKQMRRHRAHYNVTVMRVGINYQGIILLIPSDFLWSQNRW